MTDPIRWLDDPDLPETLRSDLQHAADHPPAPPLPPAPPAGLWPGWIALGAVALLAGAWLWNDSSAPDQHVVEHGANEPAVARGQDQPAPVVESVPVVETPVAPALDERVGGVADNEPASPAAPATAEAEPTLEDEIASMAEIRRLLSSNPAEALRQARRAERRFSSGIFVEERAAMIALSLHRLGRQDAAVRAASRFVTRFPTSTFAREMEEIRQSGEGSPPSSH